jgi:hypothetical protein
MDAAAIPYAGLDLDRAAGRRGDPAWIAALAADESLSADGDEIVHARWFTRDELAEEA